MRRAILAVALIAGGTVLAQDQARVAQSFQVFRVNGGFRVVAEDGRTIQAEAANIEVAKEASNAVRLKGNVRITLGGVEISADEVIYHWQTGECEPSGNVRVRIVQ